MYSMVHLQVAFRAWDFAVLIIVRKNEAPNAITEGAVSSTQRGQDQHPELRPC